MNTDPLSTMHTMFGAGREPETRTEKVLAIQAAREAAIAALRADPEPQGSAYRANETLHALKSLGPIRCVWRPVFDQAARRLREHAHNVNRNAGGQCLKAAELLETSLGTLDSLMDELLAEHGI